MIIRIASKSQALAISQLIPKAAKLTELLYTDLAPGSLKTDVEKENTKCSYKNCLLAMEGDQIVGLANFYSSEENFLIDEMRQKFDKEKIQYIAPIFQSSLPNSLYISALFVAESARGKGIGKKLIDKLNLMAKKSKRNGLTLHCWIENYSAMEFYKKLNFTLLEILNLGLHPLIPYDGRLALLYKPL